MHEPGVRVIEGRRYVTLDSDGKPTDEASRGTGAILHHDDRPKHAGKDFGK